MRLKKRIIYALYRTQQKMGITKREVTALLCISTFILLGTFVQSIQKKSPRFDESIYAETDSLFEAATAAMLERARNDSLSLAVNSGDSTAHARQNHTPSTGSAEASSLESVLLAGGKVNINTASQQELETLPRIGPAIASRIIAYRASNGPFRSVQDLAGVKGIGPKTMERLEARITVH